MVLFNRRYIFVAQTTLVVLLVLPFDALAHGISDADRQRMLSGGYPQYVGSGARHMLTGLELQRAVAA